MQQTPMTIYFDISTLNPDKVTGVGVYMLQLWERLRQRADLNVIPVLKLSRIKKRAKLEHFLGTKIQLILPWTGIRAKNALYHGPDFKILMNSFLPRAVTVHDMVVFEKSYNNPAFYTKGIKELTQVLNKKLSAVIVNSEFTKSEVLKHFPELENKTHVTYLGCDRTYPPPAPSEVEKLDKYLLFLGTLEKRKNPTAVLDAFKILCDQGYDLKLVLAGTWGYGENEIKEALLQFPYPDKVLHLNYVPNNQVAGLFKNAQAFVFPSLYEGFGIPVLEAMSLGCPVVTSDKGVLKEITGDAALHASPTDPNEIAQSLIRLFNSEELKQSLIAKGRNQAAKFTWDKCAEDTVAIYQSIIKATT
ncbi:glycosyltransferase family 4 protein [Bdellovibrio sp. HCB288]|uniref:glycosyltransferase family 4 protein n=1 Tax=Bdellovibrio sp. HCB288 TaxID=3394355 RepID=UPI0039B6E432